MIELSQRRLIRYVFWLTIGWSRLLSAPLYAEGLKTFDGMHEISEIEVLVVYFVPKDRTALVDWKDRVNYFATRIEAFHQRELDGQSILTATQHPDVFVSEKTTAELREGDGDAIFFATLREVNDRLKFGEGQRNGYPILLVLSEINWRPLDDFFRLKPTADGPVFEGNYSNGLHFPGAESGGARATYLADKGMGWGLVSADGWRVPYRGSDCVAYHEGVGHPIGLPHTDQTDPNVMSVGQYHGWISESWLDKEQKIRLGWKPPEPPTDNAARDLFSTFTAIPDPVVPKPGEDVGLKLSWPAGAEAKSLRLRFQTDVNGPWVETELATSFTESAPGRISLGKFDRPTPLSYRIDVATKDGQSAELWGYLQVREQPDVFPRPMRSGSD